MVSAQQSIFGGVFEGNTGAPTPTPAALSAAVVAPDTESMHDAIEPQTAFNTVPSVFPVTTDGNNNSPNLIANGISVVTAAPKSNFILLVVAAAVVYFIIKR
jgi:hypothetical protein